MCISLKGTQYEHARLTWVYPDVRPWNRRRKSYREKVTTNIHGATYGDAESWADPTEWMDSLDADLKSTKREMSIKGKEIECMRG